MVVQNKPRKINNGKNHHHFSYAQNSDFYKRRMFVSNEKNSLYERPKTHFTDNIYFINNLIFSVQMGA